MTMTSFPHTNERRERVQFGRRYEAMRAARLGIIVPDFDPATDDPSSEAYHLRHNFLARKPESAVEVPIREKIGRGLGLDGPVPVR